MRTPLSLILIHQRRNHAPQDSWCSAPSILRLVHSSKAAAPQHPSTVTD